MGRIGCIRCEKLRRDCKDRWTKRGGELGLFQFLKQSKATLTYAILVGHQFTNRITKLPTQAKRDKNKVKPSKVELSYDLYVKHMSKLQERKCLNKESGQETTGFFPV